VCQTHAQSASKILDELDNSPSLTSISNEFKGLQSAAALDDLALGCCNTYGAGFVDAIAIHIPGIAH
jgi:hypothetical protein